MRPLVAAAHRLAAARADRHRARERRRDVPIGVGRTGRHSLG